ncbi:uncharacterized protein LOC114477476 [Gouania willdenowi]|uniref:Uncharacterized LOC114477476 n=1 Tax=Gouania willdenowi TaxID=441366 RepID=A0A8C5ECE0_GOUWI|nr:uncharacterized protein LOC114477476 [Gouania willdenowi]
MLAVWLCVWTAVVCAQAEVIGQIGGEVVLSPPPVSRSIISITWRKGGDLAIEWEEKTTMDKYRQFQERGHLNTTTGEMTITGLTWADGGDYTVEINGVMEKPVHLKLISAVPKPVITESCDEQVTICNLTCDGNTTGAELLAYTWKSDGGQIMAASQRNFIITKEFHSKVREFSCQMENRFGIESSQPIRNPLFSAEGPRIFTGVIVFVIMLIPVVLAVVIHRMKTGVWFFDKGPMFWTADFWSRNERGQSDAVETNGSAATEQQARTEEETQMM